MLEKIKAAKKELILDWHMFMMNEYGKQCDPKYKSLVPCWVRFVIEELQCYTRALRYSLFPCKHRRMDFESHGGPDSGYDCGTCLDCGENFHHTYY